MSRYIDAYGSAIPAGHWAAIETFVKETVRASAPATVTSARQDIAAVTSLAYWAWKRGMALDAQVLLRRDIIEQWASAPETDLKQSTRATYRGRLFRIHQCIVEGPRKSVPTRAIKRTDNASRPYDPADVASFAVWARRQRTQHRREQATLLLALGFGAGLFTSEIIELRHSDIHVDAEGVTLTVRGKKARVVPVLAEWEGRLRGTAATAVLRDDFVFCPGRRTRANPRMVAAFIEDCSRDVSLLNVQRMRTTWLVGHLVAGVPPTVLTAAAGITNVGGLERVSEFLPEPEAADVRLWMRNSQQNPLEPPEGR